MVIVGGDAAGPRDRGGRSGRGGISGKSDSCTARGSRRHEVHRVIVAAEYMCEPVSIRKSFLELGP